MSDEFNLADRLPEGVVPVSFVASVKVLHANGDVGLFHLNHETMMPWEAVGILTSHIDDLRDHMRNGYVEYDSGDDDASAL
ncbi:hypothetical protein AB0383_20360 [Amycolatopsis sp. NPDC051373]|uniref:hypothetical protein n=1 Tax=Amycolatopsis sp. NPDC051373 TaxID=3155801 RepID=UPI00344BC2AA